MMTGQLLNCPNCNAPLQPQAQQCAYCGSTLRNRKQSDLESLPDFGIQHPRLLVLTVLVAAVVYALGWQAEDLTYLLSQRAIFYWAGLLPACLIAAATVWKSQWGQFLPGFAISFPIFIMHITLLWLLRGRINDDDFGISALFAALALLAWLLGRLAHHYIRRMMAQKKA